MSVNLLNAQYIKSKTYKLNVPECPSIEHIVRAFVNITAVVSGTVLYDEYARNLRNT